MPLESSPRQLPLLWLVGCWLFIVTDGSWRLAWEGLPS
jgi:hypothetical protein